MFNKICIPNRAYIISRRFKNASYLTCINHNKKKYHLNKYIKLKK